MASRLFFISVIVDLPTTYSLTNDAPLSPFLSLSMISFFLFNVLKCYVSVSGSFLMTF